jgi:hypothetical protein
MNHGGRGDIYAAPSRGAILGAENIFQYSTARQEDTTAEPYNY